MEGLAHPAAEHPSALFWIVIGTIFAGAVHDYFSGMLSLRYNGANVPTIVGYNLGNIAKNIMRVFAVVLLLLVGVVFVAAPAGLLAKLTPESLNLTFWIAVIFAYYFLATILPIDKIIGRFYPVFGAVLIIMAVGMTVGLFTSGKEFYSWLEWSNPNPAGLPVYPMVFITRKEQYSLPVGMLQFLGDKENPAQWNILFAACVLCALPLIIIFMLLQKQFINGIAAGAVKG